LDVLLCTGMYKKICMNIHLRHTCIHEQEKKMVGRPVLWGLFFYYFRAQDKMHKKCFNRLYSCYFFTGPYVWQRVRIVSMRRFLHVVKHRIWWRKRHCRNENTKLIRSPDLFFRTGTYDVFIWQEFDQIVWDFLRSNIWYTPVYMTGLLDQIIHLCKKIAQIVATRRP